MKRYVFAAFAALMLLTSATFIGNQVITKSGNTRVVNTTTLTKKVRGFAGTTPVKIYIKGNKITKIEALKNHETPKFFAKAKTVLNKFVGKSVKQAATMQVDAKTGATFSTRALIKNVQTGAKYYNQHK